MKIPIIPSPVGAGFASLFPRPAPAESAPPASSRFSRAASSCKLLLAAFLALPGAALADWVAYNAHDPGAGTSPNASTWNVFNQPPGSAGLMKNIATGAQLGVTVTITTNGMPGLSTAAAPAIGTPAFRTFNNLANISTISGSAIQLAAVTADMVTYTFTGLDPNKYYSFKGTGIRGGDATYSNRWSLFELVGANSYTSAHSAGCLTSSTPGVNFGDIGDAQVAINTGINNTAATGDIADWEDIVPALDGSFSVTCVQYQGSVPNGLSDGVHSYAITALRLQEGPPGGSLIIDQQPQDLSLSLGASAAFNVVLLGGSSPQYQWFKQGKGAIAGAIFPSFAITNAALANNGAYYVVISNLTESITSASATLTVTGVPISIVVQPVSQSVQVGDVVTFSAGILGSQPVYQWYKDDVKIAGATTPSYTLGSAQFTNQGSYYVTASNFLGGAKSAVVSLTVAPHTRPPALLSAVVTETGQTNVIVLTFSEPLAISTSLIKSNYAVTVASGGASVNLSNVNANSTTVSMRVGGPNWSIGGNYIVTVNGVTGLYTNYVAPDTQVGVSFFESLLAIDQPWAYTYDINNATDLGTAWRTNNYDDSVWSFGTAAFYLGSISSCASANTPLDPSPAQTMYFRAHFTAPTNTGRADLQLRHLIDDGAVFYLNGAQVFSYNMPTNALVTYSTPATAAIGVPTCLTNTVKINNVRSGDNVLAVEVHQANPNGTDAAFAVGLRGAITPALAQRPRLEFTPLGGSKFSISWSGNGFTLEAKTDLNAATWTPLTTSGSAYTNTLTGSHKFFRLRQ